MKYLKYLSFLLFACVALYSCDDLFGDDEEDSEPAVTDYASFTITNCERVGSVLIVDVTLKNKTKETLRNVYIGPNTMSDDLGNKYSSNRISVNSGDYSYDKTFSVLAGETASLRFKILSFDTTNKATKFNLSFACKLPSVDVEGNVTGASLTITDNRVISNGVQTPDNGLEIEVLGTSYDKTEGLAYLKFSVKNVTGEDITSFSLDPYNFSDDTGKVSGGEWDNDIAVGTDYSSATYTSSVTRSIAAGETVTYICKLPDLSKTATRISGSVGCSTGSYVLVDDRIRFYDIPLN